MKEQSVSDDHVEWRTNDTQRPHTYYTIKWLHRLISYLREGEEVSRVLASIDTALVEVVFYLAGGSVSVDYITVNIVWTPQSTKLWNRE